MTAGRGALVAGGCLSVGIALLHAGCVIMGPAAYRYFGAGEPLASLAAAGSPVPAFITSGIAVVFALFGLWAFSGAGLAPRLFLLCTSLLVIGAVYTLRGPFLPLELLRFLRAPGTLPPRELVFSAVSLTIGLLYLAGTAVEWRRRSAPRVR